MKSLWNKLVGGMGKDPTPEALSPCMSPRRHTTTSVKSKKSLSDMFGSKNKVPTSFNTKNPGGYDGASQDSELYPAYDPTNSDHNPDYRGRQEKCPRESPSLRRLRSWSPSKLSDSMRSKYHSRSRSPSVTRGRLGALAGTMRTAATFFYSQEETAAIESPMQEQISPNSAKSLSSKKSVRFRSSHSFIDTGPENGPPASIRLPSKSAPALPEIDVDGAFSFNNEITGRATVHCQSARPEMASLAGQGLTISAQQRNSADRRDTSLLVSQHAGRSGRTRGSTAPVATTPMFEIDISKENPFDDSAAISAESAQALEKYAGEFQDDRRTSHELTVSTTLHKDAVSADDAASDPTIPDLGSDPQAKSEGHSFHEKSSSDSLSNPFLSEADTVVGGEESKSSDDPSSLHVEGMSSDKRDGKSLSEEIAPVDSYLPNPSTETRLPSQQYDADDDSSDSGEEGQELETLDPVERQSSPQIHVGDFDRLSSVPDIRVRSPGSDDGLETTTHEEKFSRGHLGLLLAPEDIQSTLSLGSSCSTDILSIGQSDDALEPHSFNGLRTQENWDGSDKENLLGLGSRHASPIDPVKTNDQMISESTLDSNSNQLVLLEAAPLNLIPTVSGISPARRSPPFRYTNSTNEVAECEHVDHTAFSLYARLAAEDVKYGDSETVLPSKKDMLLGIDSDSGYEGDMLPVPAIPTGPPASGAKRRVSNLSPAAPRQDSARTPSPALIPLPSTVLPIRTKNPELDTPASSSKSKAWSALDAPDFPIVAHTMMQLQSEEFDQVLRRGKLDPHYWKKLGLESKYEPPERGIRYSDAEIRDLYWNVNEIVMNSLASETTRRKVIRRKFELMNHLRRGDLNDINDILSESDWLSKFSANPDRREYSGEVSTQSSNRVSPLSTRSVSTTSESGEGKASLLNRNPSRPFELSSSVSERTNPPNTPDRFGFGPSSTPNRELESEDEPLPSGRDMVEQHPFESSGEYGSGSHEQLSLVQHDFLSGFRKGSAGEAA